SAMISPACSFSRRPAHPTPWTMPTRTSWPSPTAGHPRMPRMVSCWCWVTCWTVRTTGRTRPGRGRGPGLFPVLPRLPGFLHCLGLLGLLGFFRCLGLLRLLDFLGLLGGLHLLGRQLLSQRPLRLLPDLLLRLSLLPGRG